MSFVESTEVCVRSRRASPLLKDSLAFAPHCSHVSNNRISTSAPVFSDGPREEVQCNVCAFINVEIASALPLFYITLLLTVLNLSLLDILRKER